jgi:hypothetical protein
MGMGMGAMWFRHSGGFQSQKQQEPPKQEVTIQVLQDETKKMTPGSGDAQVATMPTSGAFGRTPVIGGLGVHTAKIRVFKEQLEEFCLDAEGIKLILSKVAYKSKVSQGSGYFSEGSTEFQYVEKSLQLLARSKKRYTSTEFFYIDDASQQKVMKVTFAGECTNWTDKEFNILVFVAMMNEVHTWMRWFVDSNRGQKRIGQRQDVLEALLDQRIRSLLGHPDQQSEESVPSLDSA